MTAHTATFQRLRSLFRSVDQRADNWNERSDTNKDWQLMRDELRWVATELNDILKTPLSAVAQTHDVSFDKWLSYQHWTMVDPGDDTRYYTRATVRAAWNAGATSTNPAPSSAEGTAQPLICSHCGELFDALDREQTAKGTVGQSHVAASDDPDIKPLADAIAGVLDADQDIGMLHSRADIPLMTKAEWWRVVAVLRGEISVRSAIGDIELAKALLRANDETRCGHLISAGKFIEAVDRARQMVSATGSTTQAKCIGYMRSFNSDQCLRCGASEASHAADVR